MHNAYIVNRLEFGILFEKVMHTCDVKKVVKPEKSLHVVLGPMCLTAQVGELERLATGLMIEIMEFPRTWKPTILVLRLALLIKMITMS